ncbi:DUF3967 domain-containing protein [Halobacillus sp. A1]|uniref:DUF3967 domain-containing protein n=1 Tax=Halobacillus sp. A1 TaxID=2880262 RepID=UPI0020A69AF2|nr:DUF3967 domain-containing protein [Halobacillus sp. A1]
MVRTDKPYTPGEMARVLNVGDSTLRKWCIAVEKEGYFFSRTENKRRVFYENERLLLHSLRELVQVQFISIDNAAKIVASKYNQTPFEQVDSDNNVPALRPDSEQVQRMMSFIEEQQEHIQRQESYIQRQENFNKELLERLGEQHERIEERLKERDRTLMETLNELQEQKRLDQDKPKSFWNRMFGGE